MRRSLVALIGAVMIAGCGGGGGDAAPRDPIVAGGPIRNALDGTPMFQAYTLEVAFEDGNGRHRLRIGADSEGAQPPAGEWAWEVDMREPDEPVRVVQAKIVERRLQVRLGSDERRGFPFRSPDIDYYTRPLRGEGMRRPFDFGAPLDRRELDPARWVDGIDGEVEETAIGERLRGTVDPAAIVDDVARLYRALDGIRLDVAPGADDAELVIAVARTGQMREIEAKAPLEGGGELRVKIVSQPPGLRHFRTGGGWGGSPIGDLPYEGYMAVPPRLHEPVLGDEVPPHRPPRKQTVDNDPASSVEDF